MISTTGKLKIGIVATHSFPIPYPNLHTGDIVILNLANSLQEMGHQVTLYAPNGTNFSNIRPMRASFGKYPPSSEQCEIECFNNHKDSLLDQDIVHDFSVTKCIASSLNNLGYFNTCCTLMGGAWSQSTKPNNLIVWSQSHRDRVLRGATDYEGTPTPDLAGPSQTPVKEAHVVHGGIDTDFYTPTYEKKNYYLWLGRWHPVRGYKMAIEIAKKTGIELVMAGEHPENEMFDYQKQCALEAISLAKDLPNVKFEWLPKDPYHHTAKRELYRQAKALLYTVQFCEPFGLSQVESLACGTPVIGTNYGSVPEIIKENIAGYVCKNDINDFISKLDNLKNIDPIGCRKYAVDYFDRRVMATSYLKKYQEILNGNGWV